MKNKEIYRARNNMSSGLYGIRKKRKISKEDWELFKAKAFRNKQHPSDRMVMLIQRDIK